jgi:GNAT superfamily N-acetyltransferase
VCKTCPTELAHPTMLRYIIVHGKSHMRIIKFQKRDTNKVASLISRTFKTFNSSDYFSKKAADDYIKFFDPKVTSEDEIYKIFIKATIFYVAEEGGKIVGAIRGTPNRISSLFVDGKQHRKGIGEKLLLKFEKEAVKQASSEIKVRSQLYSLIFYEKMGYKKTTGIRNAKGLKVYPIKKVLK